MVVDIGFRIFKLDGSGNILWQNEVDPGDYRSTSIRSIVVAQDGGYVILGTTIPPGTDWNQVYMAKLDQSGNVMWQRDYGGDRSDVGYSVEVTDDGGYVISGSTTSFGVSSRDVYLVRTDPSGELLWQRTYGQDEYADLALSVAVAPDGGYIIGARTGPVPLRGADYYLIKTDPNGEL